MRSLTIRDVSLIVVSIVVLAGLNFGIYQKEQIKQNGEIVFLELAPVDPRSLMQGDYMALRYAIESDARKDASFEQKKLGKLVISTNENAVANYVRFYEGEALQENEKLMRYKKQHSVNIVPDSFFFQEGHAKYYESAKYGMFKFADPDNYLLVGLADEHRVEIIVEDTVPVE